MLLLHRLGCKTRPLHSAAADLLPPTSLLLTRLLLKLLLAILAPLGKLALILVLILIPPRDLFTLE